MEFSKAQKVFVPNVIAFRWPRPVLLGLGLGLFLTAFLSSNFARDMVVSPLKSAPTSAAAASDDPFSSQLFIFLFRTSNQEAALSEVEEQKIFHSSANISSNKGDGRINSANISSSKSDARTNSANVSSSKSDGRINSANISSSKRGSQMPPKQAQEPPSMLPFENHTKAAGSLRQNDATGKFSAVLAPKGVPFARKNASWAERVQPTKALQQQCDISVGSWVQDDSYPLYQPASCPFVDESFNCQRNGRPDGNYTRWRWAPRDCRIPRLNGTHLLEKLRGKRLVFVGDSLNRNQWESMLCILRQTLPNKSRIVQIQGGRISKLPGAYVFKFLDYDCRVEYYASHYLVDEEVSFGATTLPIIRLDKMDKAERRWRKANVLVFNSGHWWTPDKIGVGENCFKEKSEMYSKLDVMVAYRKSLRTWSQWVDKYVNPAYTTVFFRGYSPTHYIGGQWNSGGQCHNEGDPIFNEQFLTAYPDKMSVLDEVIRHMKVPIHVLNITRLSDFRKDAHPAIYGHALGERQTTTQLHQDCSHWCLPGLPDTWNELLYFNIIG